MLHLLNNLLLPLAQATFDDLDAPTPPPAPAHRRLSFGDLQKGLQSSNEGTPNDRHFLYILLTMVALIAVLAFILQLRERTKNAGPLNSPFRLGRELSPTHPLPHSPPVSSSPGPPAPHSFPPQPF